MAKKDTEDRKEYQHCTLGVVQKFINAFQWGASERKACQIAGIHRSTFKYWMENETTYLDQYIQKKPDWSKETIEVKKVFREEIELAKEFPRDIAKQQVFKAIAAGDSRLALKYLELTDPEFKKNFVFGGEERDPNPLKSKLQALQKIKPREWPTNSSQKKSLKR